MDNIDKILEYVRRTNPDITEEKLISELLTNKYLTIALNFSASNVK